MPVELYLRQCLELSERVSLLFCEISIPGLISSITGPCGRSLNKILLQFGTDPAAAGHWPADRIATARGGCLSAWIAMRLFATNGE